MEQYLLAYQELTGESFLNHFWDKKEYRLNYIFSKLAELELQCPLSLLKEYLSECHSDQERTDKKWECMANHLKFYMKGLQTPKAVEMLFQAADEIGISDKGLFAIEDLLLESFGLEYGCKWNYYGYHDSSVYYDFSGIDLIRPFLSIEEHQKLFHIIEHHIFVNYFPKYQSFLIGVLSKEDHLLWFPKEEARAVFLELAKTVSQDRRLENLYKIYLSKEELEELDRNRQEKEKRRLMLEQRRKIAAIRKDFTRWVAKNRNSFRHFAELCVYAMECSYDSEKEKEKCFITKRYLCNLFQKEPVMVLERPEAERLYSLLQHLFMKDELTFAELKWILSFVEVKEKRKEAV